jgi:GNAT superfamily N-acetyltransferase
MGNFQSTGEVRGESVERENANQRHPKKARSQLTESAATMTANSTTTAQPTAHGKRKISIQVLSKNGPHNKWFDSRAAQLTQALYAVHFGPPRVTETAIRALNIQHALWIEDAEGTPIAATMLMHHPHLKYYRVSGLAVDAVHQQQGLGRALMHRLMTDASLIKESAAELRVGVDTDTPSTEWLRQWYARLGFTEEVHQRSVVRSDYYHYYDDDEPEDDEILMRKQIVRREELQAE